MNKKSFVVCITLLFILETLSGVGWGKADAHMFRGDLQHTGIYESTMPENNSLLWSFDTDSVIESSPVVSGDKVYFGAENGKVYCINISSGNESWNFSTNNEVDSTPVVVDGVVYIGSADNNLYAIDSENKTLLWSYTTGGQIVSSPAINNDMVFIGSKDKKLYAINITTQESEWNFTTEGEIWSSPAVDWPYVYIGSLDGYIYCIWANNGTECWNFSSNLTKFPHGIYASPLISNGKLYIGSEDYNLYCLDAKTGNLIWNYSAPYYIYASASVHDGIVFVHTQGTPDGIMYALPENDPNKDGVIEHSEVLWSFETRDFEGGSSPAIADGKVVFGSTFTGSPNGKLFCLDEYTGEEIWNLTTGGPIVASPAIADKVVYIGSRDGTLYAIGGLGPAILDIQIIPEYPAIKSNRVMGISFVVTHNEKPIEGAFITVNVSSGELSQQGASTFGDGSQRIKYTASEVDENTTVIVQAKATKFGYSDGNSTAQFIVESPSSYENVKTSSMFSLSKYWVYLVLIGALIAVNVVIFVLNYKRRKMLKTEKMNEEKE